MRFGLVALTSAFMGTAAPGGGFPLHSGAVPVSWNVQGIADVNGRPVLLGAQYLPNDKTDDCLEATVQVTWLHLGKAERYPCSDDPAADGAAYPVATIRHTFDAEVRITRTDLATGRTTLGPVVMSFGQYSASRMVTTSSYSSL
jgi:hypothetical protein